MVNVLSCSLIIFIMLLSIGESIYRSNKDKSITNTVNKVLYYLSIFITLLLLIFNIEKVSKYIQNIVYLFSYLDSIYIKIIKVIFIMVFFFIIQICIYTILRVLLPLFNINRKIESKILLFSLSSIFGVLKSISIIAVLFITIIVYNSSIAKEFKVNIFDDFKSYNIIQTILSKERKAVLDLQGDDYLNTNSNNVIIFYNGVTLEEGIESSNEIDNMAIDLTKDLKSDRDKSMAIYIWIGNNIKYDYKKAEKALNNEKLDGSGAIDAWENRRGICFDFACLYVAMARKCDLNVRLITGEAFDGINYGPHAWNEVYLQDENKWITVDSTFYTAGNYFDSNFFYDDHIKENVAGQW